MLCNMENALKNRVHVVAPYVPKEHGFSHSRFMGRYLGFYHATWNDVRSPRMVKEKYGSNDDDVRIALTSFTEEEQVAVDKLKEKINASNHHRDSEESFRLGLWEGIAILINKEDTKLLYRETDIDLYKGIPSSKIPSYEYSRLSTLAINEYLNKKKSVNDVAKVLQEEGIGEGDARRIIQGVLPTIQRMGLPVQSIQRKTIYILLAIGLVLYGGFIIARTDNNSIFGLAVFVTPFIVYILYHLFSTAKERESFQKRINKDIEESGISSQWQDTSKPIIDQDERVGVRSLSSPTPKTNYDLNPPTEAVMVLGQLDKQYKALVSGGIVDEDMPNSHVFSASRFKGRELGFIMALICDRMNREVFNDSGKNTSIAPKIFSWFNGDLVLSSDSHFRWGNVELVLNNQEKRAIVSLKNKIDSCPPQDSLVYEDAITGSFEGMVVYLTHEDSDYSLIKEKYVDLRDDFMIGLAAKMDEQYRSLLRGTDVEVSESKRFSPSRYYGRLFGYVMALVCDRMAEEVKEAQAHADCPKNARIAWNIFNVCEGHFEWQGGFSWDKVRAEMEELEKAIFDELCNKATPMGAVVDKDDASCGTFEGMVIYMHKLPLTLLCADTNLTMTK